MWQTEGQPGEQIIKLVTLIHMNIVIIVQNIGNMDALGKWMHICSGVSKEIKNIWLNWNESLSTYELISLVRSINGKCKCYKLSNSSENRNMMMWKTQKLSSWPCTTHFLGSLSDLIYLHNCFTIGSTRGSRR